MKVILGGDTNENASDFGVGKDIETAIIQDLPVQAKPSPFQSLHQIPPPDGDFIGRNKELKELLDEIKQSGVHISGIKGMGGIGKTQLAWKLAEHLIPQYPDAQIYLDLKGVTEDDQVPLKPEEALAHVIRTFEPEVPLPEKVEELRPIFLSILEDKKVILLMDNALDENQTRPLIPPKGSILLVTSRQNFHLPGIHLVSLDTLSEEESIQLLLNISNNRISEHAKLIAELCGYLPLALNVAGKTMAEHPHLSPEEYIEELKKNKALWPVDRSLAVGCEWLDENERKYFYQLWVFPGSFDLRAAGALWERDEEAVKKFLSNLVNISLVEWSQKTQRYHLHDLTRIFARKQLEKTEHYANQKRHAEHYIQILEAANLLYKEGGDNVLVGLHLFDLEWENIETGQAWSAQHSETDETATNMCNQYPDEGSFIFTFRQHPRRRIQWRESALAASRKLKLRSSEGLHLCNLGSAYSDLGDYQKAIDYLKKARPIFVEIEDRENEGVTVNYLGNSYYSLGEYQEAIKYHERALKISQEIEDKSGEGNALGSLGNHYKDLENYPQAIEYYERALKISREIKDPRLEGRALLNLGIVYMSLGKTQKAIERYDQQLKIVREIGDKGGEGRALFNMSLIEGDRTEAIKLAKEAFKILEAIGTPDAEKARKQLEEWKKEA